MPRTERSARPVTGRRLEDRTCRRLPVAMTGPLFALALATVSVELGAQAAPTFERLATLDLPEEVVRATDVRWLDDGEILLGVGGAGVYAWRIGEENAKVEVSLTETRDRPRAFRSYSRLGGAGSGGAIGFGDIAFGVYLQGADGARLLKPVEIVGDVDRRGDLTAAIGLSRRSGEYRRGDWEDHIAWLFEDEAEAARGLLPTRDAGQGMNRCWEAGISSIRFISEDRVLVVPGAEPGVFVYDRSGALVESLAAETFSADGGCEIGEDQSFLLGQPLYRLGWLGRRRVVDEIVADGDGNVWFFVRRTGGAGRQGVSPSPVVAESTEGDERAAGRREESGAGSRGSGSPPVRISGEEAERLIAAAGAAVHETLIDTGETTEDGGRRMIRRRGFSVGQTGGGPDYDPQNPPRGAICWDLVHAEVEDLANVTRLPCAVEADLADARLRADLRGNRAVILIRGFDGLFARPAEAFEARITPAGG